MLQFPSLFFFRSRHLFKTLELLVNDDRYRKEKNFWQKSEDLILRVKGQYSLEEIAQVCKIFCHVPVSQIFWAEMEKLVLSLSAGFKGRRDLLIPVVRAFRNRNSEIFWKVFSGHIKGIKDELNFEDFVLVLDVLDYSNGEALFDDFVKNFFM